jgi:hypothetical protein
MTTSHNEDKFNLEYSARRKHSDSTQGLTRDDLVMKDYYGDLGRLMHNLVGPAFLAGGAGGILYGFMQSVQYWSIHRSRPSKLLFSASLNIVGKNCSKYANVLAALALLYCFDKRAINFMFKEELEGTTELQKQIVYGFTTGFVFKVFTKGIASGLLAGALMGSASTLPFLFEVYIRNKLKK